jgi:hypothetical protein
VPDAFVYSVRSAVDLICAGELEDDTVITYTRKPRAGWSRPTGRIDADPDGRASARRAKV